MLCFSLGLKSDCYVANILSGIELLLELADTISSTALCGLGKTAAFPVVSTIKREIPLVAWYYPDTKKSASHIHHSNLMEKWTSKDRYTKQICLSAIWTYRARIMELRELSTLLWARSKEKSRCDISLTLSCEKAHRIIIQRAFAV